jgi:Mlc titration factor MtfA (ptsG expression regulator)
MDDAGDLIGILFLLAVLLLFISGGIFILFNIIESVVLVVFDRPIYVHFYPMRKELTTGEADFLEKEFAFYRTLTKSRKKYFRHRVQRFIKRYRFIGRQGLEVTPDMQLKIAGTWVMLTFGMRSYLPDIFDNIVIFPEIFESQNGNMHKGEFNPMLKAVVFSWVDFEQGYVFENDNLNLGLHEFAHVLHLNCTFVKRPGASGMVYADMFEKVKEYIDSQDNRQHLLNLGYLREYAYTNNHEFMAVVLEHFFETPQEFRQKLPELYEMVRKMINYRAA